MVRSSVLETLSWQGMEALLPAHSMFLLLFVFKKKRIHNFSLHTILFLFFSHIDC